MKRASCSALAVLVCCLCICLGSAPIPALGDAAQPWISLLGCNASTAILPVKASVSSDVQSRAFEAITPAGTDEVYILSGDNMNRLYLRACNTSAVFTNNNNAGRIRCTKPLLPFTTAKDPYYELTNNTVAFSNYERVQKVALLQCPRANVTDAVADACNSRPQWHQPGNQPCGACAIFVPPNNLLPAVPAGQKCLSTVQAIALLGDRLYILLSVTCGQYDNINEGPCEKPLLLSCNSNAFGLSDCQRVSLPSTTPEVRDQASLIAINNGTNGPTLFISAPYVCLGHNASLIKCRGSPMTCVIAPIPSSDALWSLYSYPHPALTYYKSQVLLLAQYASKGVGWDVVICDGSTLQCVSRDFQAQALGLAAFSYIAADVYNTAYPKLGNFGFNSARKVLTTTLLTTHYKSATNVSADLVTMREWNNLQVL
eukprot:jgi/Chlat1/7196/Chrsp57S06851